MTNSDDAYPGLPSDPIGIVEELEALLAADSEGFVHPDDMPTAEELEAQQRVDEISIRFVAELRKKGVDLELGDALLEEAEEPEDDRLYDARYLALKLVYGIDELSTGEDDLLREAIARVIVNSTITDEDRQAYLDATEAILGPERFTPVIVTLMGGDEIERARQTEIELGNIREDATELRQDITDALIDLGVSPEHDDFRGFTERLMKAVHLRSSGAPNQVMNPTLQLLKEQAARIGLEEKVPDLFRLFEIED